MNHQSPIENPDAQALLNQLVIEHLREQKRKRFWRKMKYIGVLLFVLYVAYLLSAMRNGALDVRSKPHVGVIELSGAMGADHPVAAENFIKSLKKAYKSEGLKALILRIDSPGGSPVHADYMYDAVRYYHQKYPNIKTYAVCVDMCASAAYYVAAAADEIYANPASLVGSIGVIYNGFGFVDTMQKLGVSRRLQTAGRNKGFLDQFSPVNPAQEKTLQTMLDLIHQQFIDKVKEGRGARLKVDEDTFSGLIWTGTQAKERGLIDGFASSDQLARDTIKIEQTVDYTDKKNVFEQVAKRIGTTMVNQLPVAFGMQQGIASR